MDYDSCRELVIEKEAQAFQDEYLEEQRLLHNHGRVSLEERQAQFAKLEAGYQ